MACVSVLPDPAASDRLCRQGFLMEAWLDVAAVYVVVTRIFLSFRPGPSATDRWFAVSGLAFTYICFFNTGSRVHMAAYGLTVLLVLWFYLVLLLYRSYANAGMALLAMGGPVAVLAFVKLGYIPMVAGLSYLTFRMSYLAYELHAGRVSLPGLQRYLGFMFFPLTFLIGPISPYRLYAESLDMQKHRTPATRALGRILVGLLKCYIFAQLFKTLSFFNYWQPYYTHGFSDFTLSSMATALYIYFNFSGACDIIIGAAALLGFKVQENFNNPFLSRNLAEYWTRNHITLAQVVRDVLFTPALLCCARLTRGRFMLLVTSVLTVTAFLILGVWHGKQLGFVLFGLMHGVGVLGVHGYGALLRRLPRRVQQWNATRPARLAATAITFLYVSYSSVFFGNDRESLREIFSKLIL